MISEMDEEQGRTAESKSHDWERAHDHAWRYFELHAGQRLTVFNFFTVLTGFAAAGIAATLQGSARFSLLGVALGTLLALLSFVFWKLDQRAAFLVKHAEGVHKLTEVELLPAGARLVAEEPAALLEARQDRSPVGRIWTFGTSFRLIFVAAAIFGAISAILCGLRFAGLIEWNRPAAEVAAGTQKAKVVQKPTVEAPAPSKDVPARTGAKAH